MNVLDKSQTLTAIRAIAKSDGKLKDKIQAAAIGALVHAGEHGDTGLMAKLVLAVNATAATQLRKYFQEFAPVTWNTGKGTFSKRKKGGAYRAADAMGINWYDALEAKQTAAKAYDSEKVLARTVTALEKARDLAEDNLDTATAIALEIAITGLQAPVDLRIAA